ncbi:MAG: amino acid adenylation domain-containing protein [Clostridiales Family XIII bacterium]|jgi:pyochelin synthetase|nr:amino acid adenylation domain-containing protein [Clostridiales Family XIII bacterium]
MNISELIEEYEVLGVKMWVEDGALKFKSPVGVMTDIRKETLKKHKESLVSYLNHADAPVLIHDEVNRHAAFPLTGIQEAYLFGRNQNFDSSGVGCHAYCEIALKNADRGRLEAAWHKTILRHDMLHAIVYPDGSQKVLREFRLPGIPEYEAASAGDFERRVAEVRTRLSHKQYQTDAYPLYDFEITKYGDESTLHVSFDMLIADFVSIRVVLKDMMAYYADAHAELPELDITFRDFLLFRERQAGGLKAKERLRQDREYWLGRVGDLPQGPELPVVGKISNDNVRFEQRAWVASAEEWESIGALAQRMRVTPSVLVLAAYAEMLGKWSKNKNFCVNLTLLNRPDVHPQIGGIVGDFTDVDVLEIAPKAGSSFLERVKAIQNRLWSDLGHNAFSGIQVLRELAKTHGRNVIIPIVYTSTAGMSMEDGAGCAPYEIRYSISQTPQVWIDCQVSDWHGGVRVNWDVREGVFREGVLDDMFEAFTGLLADLAKPDFDPSLQSPIRLSPKYREVVDAVNATGAPFVKGTLMDGFLAQAKDHPGRTALICEEGAYSYGELAECAARVQEELLSLGAAEKDRVCIALDKGVWQIAAILGVLSIGAAYVPVNVSQPLARQRAILKDAACSLCVTDVEGLLGDGPDSGLSHITPVNPGRLAKERSGGLQAVSYASENTAYIIYTSGSTGQPKGVVIRHEAALNTILDINERFGVTQEDRIIGLSEIAFDLSVYDIFGAFQAGAALVLPDAGRKTDPGHWDDLIARHRVSIWNTVPALMQMYAGFAANRARPETGSLRLVLLSGDWIPVSLPGEVRELCPGAQVISLGGATEASIWSIFFDTENYKGEESIPYGTPLRNQRFHVLDAGLEPCPFEVAGSLYIAGSGLAEGYFNDEEATKHAFLHHPQTRERIYHTGDLGRYRADGAILFLGRDDSQIKIHGYRVEIGEIENVLKAHPKLRNAAVIAERDAQGEYRIGAFVLPAESDEERDGRLAFSEELREYCGSVKTAAFQELPGGVLDRWIALSERIALFNMIGALRSAGLFRNAGDVHTESEIIKMLHADGKYTALLSRWLRALGKEGLLGCDSAGGYRLAVVYDEDRLRAEKAEFAEIEKELQNSPVLSGILCREPEALVRLISGQERPLDYLFPEGGSGVALAAYQDNRVARCFNGIVHQVMMKIAGHLNQARAGQPVRILEVGAGVGGTSNELIPHLDGLNVRYRFTDVSNYFLNEAKKRFQAYPWVEYGIYDVNEDYSGQGLKASEADIILCANVLHNAKDGKKHIAKMAEMLSPGGFLVVIDAISETYSLMTSMGFVYDSDEIIDDRRLAGSIFFDHAHWMDLIRAAGLALVCDAPGPGEQFYETGQHLFICRADSPQLCISGEEIEEYLRGKLPHYMIPHYIEALPTLPLTENGKVNREALRRRIENRQAPESTDFEPPVGDVEAQIAGIWSEVLGKGPIGRRQNFYEIGGDSLTIAQVVSKMKETVAPAEALDWNTLLQLMIEGQTVEGVAKGLLAGASGETAAAKPDCYSILKAETDTLLKEIVLFADGTGTLSIYRALLEMLSSKANESTRISGFAVEDAEAFLGMPETESIVGLGRKYAERLRSGPGRRICLVGHCMGALIALETCRELQRAGVASELFMIDPRKGDSYRENVLLQERGFAQLLGADLARCGHAAPDEALGAALQAHFEQAGVLASEEDLCAMAGRHKNVGDCYAALSRIPQWERFENMYKTLHHVDAETITDFEIHRLIQYYKVFVHSYKSVVAYRPEPFAMPAHMLSCTDRSRAFLTFMESEVDFAQAAGAPGGRFEECTITGDHLSCMRLPEVGQIAAYLEERGVFA